MKWQYVSKGIKKSQIFQKGLKITNGWLKEASTGSYGCESGTEVEIIGGA
jgi:hypothetical protein